MLLFDRFAQILSVVDFIAFDANMLLIYYYYYYYYYY